jgi:hypothetical protein
MGPLRQVGSRVRLLRAPRTVRGLTAPFFMTAEGPCTQPASKFAAPARFLHVAQAEADASGPSTATPVSAADLEPPTSVGLTDAKPANDDTLFKCLKSSASTYHEALKAFNELRSRGLKLKEAQYLSLLFKALREGRYDRVWSGYEEFLEDETQGLVMARPIARTTWPKISNARMQMHRYVLWAMLDTQREQEMMLFYQNEVVGKLNVQGIHEADPLNFLLRLECTTRVMYDQEHGVRQRVEMLLSTMEKQHLHTSYSSIHSLFRLILHRPKIFVDGPTDEDDAAEEVQADAASECSSEVVGKLIVGYLERFPYAAALDPKRLSIAVSAAAATGLPDVATLLLEYGAANRVPIDAGSFAHAVESAPNDASRMKIADLYMHAKEQELLYTTQGTEGSITNYLLLHAVFDGNFKHMMELLHEMQLNNNKTSNRTVRELFKSIAQYRAQLRHPGTEQQKTRGSRRGYRQDAERKLAECPTVLELFERFPNVIPRTVHSFSQGILQSLHAGDLEVGIDLMRAALWAKDITLRPEIYSQLLYPLLAGGQRGGDEASDASVFDRLEVERCFDRQHPKQRTYLNSLIVNICQANDDLSTMLVCLDRWQGQGHPPMSRRVVKRVFEVISKQIQQLQQRQQRDEEEEITRGTAFVVDGMQLSYLAFLVRYRKIMLWDAWTLERAIVRARTSGLHADVVSLLAEANARGLVLSSTAYIVSLSVLEAVGEPSAVVACAERMRAHSVWEKAVEKDPEVLAIVSRASAKLNDQEL